MSKIVKLAAAMPADDLLNGLDSELPSLLAEPNKVRAALVTYDVDKFAEDPKSGTKIPTIRTISFEPLGDVGQLGDAIVEQRNAAMAARTGRTPLPLDTVSYNDSTAVGDDD